MIKRFLIQFFFGINLKFIASMPPQQHLQDDLEDTATALRMALDISYQADFAVYDLGFYAHHSKMVGGIPEVMAKAISDRITHSYYLVFGREMDDQGDLKRVWVEVELPEEEWLLECFNQTYIQVFKAGIRNKAEEFFEQYSKPASHPVAKIQTILYFAEKLAELAGCCEPCGSRHQSCQLCETTEEIYGWLMDYGFIGIKVENITYDVPVSEYNNIVDFAGIYMDGISLAQKVNELLGNIAELNNTSATGYLTDNSNFCSGTVDFVIDEYSEDLSNFDVWVHLWNDTFNNVQILFVRTEFYILLDDPDFMEYYDGEGPITLMDPVSRSQQTDSLHFFIIDPETNLFYITTKIIPLPRGIMELAPYALPSQPVHIIKSGETLGSIVDEWGNGFDFDDLIKWNPAKLMDENTILQVGWHLKLYTEEYIELLKNEFDIWGFSVPDIPLHLMNLVAPDAHPQLGGAVPLPFGPHNPNYRPTLRINKNTNYNDIQKIIKKESKWNFLRNFPKPSGNVLLTLGRASNVFLLMLSGPQAGQPYSNLLEVELRFKEKLEEEEDDKKLTYVTYTKYNPNEINETPLINGKIYAGRTSGYNKNPIMLIRNRDKGHHKWDEDYVAACYDHHEYSLKNSRNSRHNDRAYKTIRGREQKIIVSMGGAWSDNKGKNGINKTRSGNAINGIAKSRVAFYNKCMELAESIKLIINEVHPPKDWAPFCP
ncbi:MAG: LysM domain-containing protein [Saprospirales bacterium]|nr:MAG: LysM domain-containing protein [Saprospirales bacterium]